MVADQFEHVFAVRPQADPFTEEKRNSPRFPWSAEMALILLPGLETAERPEQALEAEAENIAKGGIGMLCNRPLPPGTVVRCEIAFPNQAVHIPTLLKVRWSDFLEGKKRYRVGLQFLL